MKYKNNGYNSIVNAIYTDSEIPSYKGNIFIESLPEPITDTQEIINLYTKDILDEDKKDLSHLPKKERLKHLQELANIRLALPFHSSLEEYFYQVLCNAYKGRKVDRIVYCDNEKLESHANPMEGIDSGFALIGHSGVGKSSALKILTEHYPQVIKHKFDDTHLELTQIVYLYVNCVPNSNFKALYDSIAIEIDRAIGTGDYYFKQMNNKKSLGDKSIYLKSLIRSFSIGMIMLDEIQLINFDSTKENSFEALINIANDTKCAFSLIGTEETWAKINPHMRNARRTGMYFIEADHYTKNYNFFCYILNNLWSYNFFDEKVELTDEICKSFYDKTKGFVFAVIYLYIRVCNDYLTQNKAIEINPDYINKVTDRTFEKIRESMEGSLNINEYEKAELFDELFKVKLVNERQTVDAIEIEEITEKNKREFLQNKIVEGILYVHADYNKEKLADCVKELCEKYPGLSEPELIKLTIEKYRKPKSKKMSNGELAMKLGYNA